MSEPTAPPPRLPIKLVLPKQGTERRVTGGGGEKKPFRQVTRAYRENLVNQVEAAERTVPWGDLPAAPMRVRILPKATAKTHRPLSLFSDRTCPIVGVGRSDELFVKATRPGLSALKRQIDQGRSEELVKALSCVERIEPVTPQYRRRNLTASELLRRSPVRDGSFVARVRLFDFGPGDEHLPLHKDFERLCMSRGFEIDTAGYSKGTYSVRVRHEDDVESLSRALGVRSIAGMPLVRPSRQRLANLAPFGSFPIRSAGDDVPVVVVVDTGISDAVPGLKSWVVGRDRQVADEYVNTDHGTFVAGLICWARQLNPLLAGVDDEPCGVYDLQIVPNHDPEKGETLALLENELLQSLEGALQDHANRYKVWTLSLGTDLLCSLEDFSELAKQLDDLQERFQVSFVISAGNYEAHPMLDYPRTTAQQDAGRISSPADSVLGVTVGSISHVDLSPAGAGEHCPSAFSRHGAGPNYVIKPDLVHYGGACAPDDSDWHGIHSVTSAGVVEDIGTSFATPLVSRTLAQIYHQITPTPSPVLARALLTHHARDPRSGLRVPDGDENALGFGLPAVVPYCLECTANTATLVFEDTLRPGYFLQWDSFPYPPSLQRNGRYFGEVWMTLAFAPSRGARWGAEYCETHIDAHLGVYRKSVSRKTGEVTTKFVGLVPAEHRNRDQLFEAFQVEHLRKWSPVRTYHGRMGEKGEKGERWRLKLQLLSRNDAVESQRPQPFALIITVADPLGQAPVYDEVSQILRSRWEANNLAVRGSVRTQSKLGRGPDHS